jgi:hypothetical protein
MAKLIRKRFVDVAPEGAEAYGVDPAAGRVALLPYSDMALTVEGNTVVRDILRDTLSPRGHVITDRRQSLTLPLELRGAGLTSTTLNVPEIDGLLKACAMQRSAGARLVVGTVAGTFVRGETVNNTTATNAVGVVADFDAVNGLLWIRDLTNMPADTNALLGATSAATAVTTSSNTAYVYRPDSPEPGDQASVFLRYDLDGNLHTIPGARGTFSVSLTKGEIPRINFTLSGLWAEPTDDGPITGTALALQPAPALGAQLILGDLDMSDIAVQSLQIDLANDVQPREDIQAADGFHSMIVVGRDPTGSIDPEVADMADFDPFTDWSAGTLIPIAAGIGSARGSRVRIVMPATQYTQLPYAERNGIATYQIGFRAVGDDDEMMVIYA